MRVTQTMMTRQYTRRVSSTLGNLDYVNKQVGSGRKFFKGSENPAGAAKAYQLRRQTSQVNDYVSNVEDAISTLQTKESSMDQVNKATEDAYKSLLGIMNGTNDTKEGKEIISKQFKSIQETIVKDMNTKYGDKFLFGGGSVSEVPFELKNGILTYRGVDVSGKTDYTYPPDSPLADKVLKGTNNGGSTEVLDLLKSLSTDAIYSDMGFGLEFKGDEIVQSSAYNSSTPGINVVGYGTDANGLPNNIVLLLGEMADKLHNDFPVSDLDPYLTKFKEQKQTVLNSITKTGSDSMFLNYTQNRLESLQDNIEKKTSDTEHINAEEAIMNLNTIDYMYQALLKTGKNILSNSFIDFMS